MSLPRAAPPGPSGPAPAGVFISYRRDDAAGHAGRLFDALQARFGRGRVFMDIDTLEPGVDFLDAIEEAVSTWAVVLAVIGPRWLAAPATDGTRRLDNPDDLVRQEIARALAHRVRVVPVLVDGAAMPPAAALPDDLRPLTRRHAHEVTNARWRYDVDRLIAALDKVVGESRPPGMAPAPPDVPAPEDTPTRPDAPPASTAREGDDGLQATRGRRLEPGMALGSYRLVERLGAGATTEVWKGLDGRLDRLAAIKVPRPEFAEDVGFRQRFLTETRAIARVHHPNVLPIWEVGEQAGLVYVVVPLADGTLADRFGAGDRWAPLAALRLLEPLAAALDHLHGRGIIHREVKPSNVLLTEHDDVLLGMVGVTRFVASQSGATPGLYLGTPSALAPEQIRGDPPGPAADRYALATIAYQLLTGRGPFPGESPLAVLHGHVHAPVPAASAINPLLPPAVDAVVTRGLAKEPADRYPSAAEFLAALREALGREVASIAAPAPTGSVVGPGWPVGARAARRLQTGAPAGADEPPRAAAGPSLAAPAHPVGPHVAGRPSIGARSIVLLLLLGVVGVVVGFLVFRLLGIGP